MYTNLSRRIYGKTANETTIHQRSNTVGLTNIGNCMAFNIETKSFHIVIYKRPRHEKYEAIQLRTLTV